MDELLVHCPTHEVCSVNIGVYGYIGGSFSLSATTDSITQLQSGRSVVGGVSKHAYRYYKLRNDNMYGVLTFSLTTLSGDSDIYVTTQRDNEKLKLPTSNSYKWASSHIGSDSISVNYIDDAGKYCYNCDYIVGIYGYLNSTFSMLATDSVDSIIRLANNVPQVFTMPESPTISPVPVLGAFGRQYFSAAVATSADDMLITLTPLIFGTVSVFVQAYDMALYKSTSNITLPDPDDSSSYISSATIVSSSQNYLTIPGPHSSDVVFVILAMSHPGMIFNILARVSQTPVRLQVTIFSSPVHLF